MVPHDLSTEIQNDHVCMGWKYRRSLQDVCVKRGRTLFCQAAAQAEEILSVASACGMTSLCCSSIAPKKEQKNKNKKQEFKTVLLKQIASKIAKKSTKANKRECTNMLAIEI